MKRDRPSLGDLVRVATWQGVSGFGGGFAVMQRLRRDVVEDRQWLSDEEFQETVAVSTALPGTAATHLLTLLGQRFHGSVGAALAASCFLAPSFLAMVAFAAAYDGLRNGVALGFLDGMGLATVGVVGAVAVDMARTGLRCRRDWLLAALALTLLASRVASLLFVVTGAALLGALALASDTDARATPAPRSLRVVWLLPMLGAVPVGLVLFGAFARVGLLTFGGGFAMIPALEAETVRDHAWLAERAFTDAMVFGQITPGPVAIAATFIGYRVDGVSGAVLATLGMFLPPFLVALGVGRSLTTYREHPAVRGALRGIAPTVVGVVAASAVALGRTSVRDAGGLTIALLAFVLLLRLRRLSPLVALAAGGLLELARHYR